MRFCHKHNKPMVWGDGGPGHYWHCDECMDDAHKSFIDPIGPKEHPLQAIDRLVERMSREHLEMKS